MTLDQLTAHVRTLEVDDVDGLWLGAAFEAAKDLPLFSTPNGDCETMDALYEAMGAIAEQFRAADMHDAWSALEEADQQVRQRPRIVDGALPSDAAVNYYTPRLDAAYFLGLAMGLRLASIIAKAGVR
jgi:hypothetical protein